MATTIAEALPGSAPESPTAASAGPASAAPEKILEKDAGVCRIGAGPFEAYVKGREEHPERPRHDEHEHEEKAMTQQMTAPGRVAAAERLTGWALCSRLSGALFLAAFAAVSTGAGAVWADLAFTAGVVIIWAWFSAVSPHLYRRVPSHH
ncbi:hypothetical protein [Nonomuraea pusilla]|uniref:Uncharacterized protein n=1 Tax=Nonomuraea pusilla TaxID=46177 RepID=A0A1H7LRV6_9ACTN|nr:hypothetical protein [Nonomuraea pusilla]SEL01684.1 hypothetical protein SAMN05660976_01656 [Nonomuraea pusilla]